MTAFNLYYINTRSFRRGVVTLLGYSAKTVQLEFNTFGGNLSILQIEPK